jgi:RNA-binding protein
MGWLRYRIPCHPISCDSDLAAAARRATLGGKMYDFPLTSAQKAFLRGLGQQLEPALKVGKSGLTPALFAELQILLRTHELVKLRFLAGDREQQAVLVAQIADEGRCVCVGAVGHTALFYRQNPEPAERRVALPA